MIGLFKNLFFQTGFMSKLTHSHLISLIAVVFGIGTGFLNQKILITAAEAISTLFLNYLSMIAAPLILFSILSTLIGMRGFAQMKVMGRKVITYTLLTTTISALVALGCFLIFDPVASVEKATGNTLVEQPSYLHFLLEIIPSNLFKAFLENKVISIAFLGFLFGITAHLLPDEQRSTLQKGVSALFQLFLKGNYSGRAFGMT